MTKRLTRLSILTALSLVIFIAESYIPPVVPIAGVKLGLANIITLICVSEFSKRDTFLVLSVRIILSSIFCGTFISFLYSIAGGIFSAVIMIISNKILKTDLLWVTSVFGAISHNLAQIIVAMILLHEIHIAYYFAPLLISAIITGIFTGVSASVLINRFFKKGLYKNENY